MIKRSIVVHTVITVYWTVYTQAHSVHKNTGEGDVPANPLVGAIESTVTRVPDNALTINSTNGNSQLKQIF